MRRKQIKLTDEQAEKLLKDIEQLDDEMIIPVSDEEAIALEFGFQPLTLSKEVQNRRRKTLENLRQGWVQGIQPIEGLIAQAKAIGISRSELSKQLRLDTATLIKLDQKLIRNVPFRLIKMLSEILQIEAPTLYVYFAEQPKQMQQMAAFSSEKPTNSRSQTWEEAVKNSSMLEEDKTFWYIGG